VLLGAAAHQLAALLARARAAAAGAALALADRCAASSPGGASAAGACLLALDAQQLRLLVQLHRHRLLGLLHLLLRVQSLLAGLGEGRGEGRAGVGG
jgi:hypothetical protein